MKYVHTPLTNGVGKSTCGTWSDHSAMMNSKQTLIERLKERGVLTSSALVCALETIDRADFVPEKLSDAAYENTSLPIGKGQTISQPYTVVFMLEQLNVQLGERVLEVGYGSGWQTALLAHLVGPTGEVYAMELVPELCQRGERNLRQYPDLFGRAHLFCRSAEWGCEEGAPFDRIIAAAEVRHTPSAWRRELRIGGTMIYPQGSGLVLEVKTDAGFETTRFPGFVFVPFM